MRPIFCTFFILVVGYSHIREKVIAHKKNISFDQASMRFIWLNVKYENPGHTLFISFLQIDIEIR